MLRIGIKCVFIFVTLIFVTSLQSACAGDPKTECNPACGSDEECKNGVCQKKQSGTCNPACGSGEECVNGTCQKKAECNPVCKSDEECKNGTCQKKAECNPACGSDEECKNGVCQKKQSGTCNPACGSDEECVNGTCQKKAECNPVCKSDEECKNGTCQKKQSGSTLGRTCDDALPCSSGLECHASSNGIKYCVQRCQEDSECTDTFRNKCLTIGTDSQNNILKLCLHESNKGEECSFSGPKQRLCKRGLNPPLFCDRGTCQENLPSGSVGTGCSDFRPCSSDLFCDSRFRYYCVQRCQEDSECTDTFRNKCLMFEADPEGRPVVKACLHESNKDEECGLEGRKQGICKKGLYPPLYCDNSLQKCKEAIVQTEKGKPCNKKGDDTQPIKICDASVGLTCVESSGTCRKVIFSEEGGECDKLDKDGNHLSCKEQSPPLYCDNFHQKCKEAIVQTEKGKPCNKKGDKTQPIKVCDASAGLTCIESSGTCRKVIISKEGGECDKLDEAGNHLSCGKGLICFDYRRNGVKDGWLTRCHIPCDKKNLDAECTTKNTKCRTYNDVDICIDSQCKIMEDCAFPGFQCLGGGGPRSTCYPLERSGTRKMGNICNAQYGCDTSKDPRAFCYTPTLQSKAGVCSSLCSDRLPCSIPGQDANGKAIYPQCLKSQDKSYCLFKCDGGYVCPINLTCQSSKFGDICLP